MNERLTIPKKINVGFQSRNDTYSGKLAFIVYTDDKGNLRQEKSWNGWRDKKIPQENYDNEPISGFVLNKDVGGVQRSYSWNSRREKVRVYDPRGFEIEINVENLLFVLQECSSIKGKGLEGEFVYGWSGTSLVLLPTCSNEYKKSSEFTKLQTKKLSKKDIVEGHVYRTKDNIQVMYLGRHLWYRSDDEYSDYGHAWEDEKTKKRHVFVYTAQGVNPHSYRSSESKYLILDGFVKLAEKVGDEPAANYAEEYEELMKTPYVSPITEIIPKKFPKSRLANWGGNHVCVLKNDKYVVGEYRPQDNVFIEKNKVEIEDGKVTFERLGKKSTASNSWRSYETWEYKHSKAETDDLLYLNFKCENGSEIKRKIR